MIKFFYIHGKNLINALSKFLLVSKLSNKRCIPLKVTLTECDGMFHNLDSINK